ncbi:Fmp33p [Saccharomyces eubayanus]|uniref:Fmp33p n=1 Tax=Saccharomyces eubayanus TaxID=1080349 RepID=UPI0006C3C619|nr:FMP33-like protein [Saccharomyces eubayanus]KOG98460.1 FMP33-like protein [Saccharomyces eubayanus]
MLFTRILCQGVKFTKGTATQPKLSPKSLPKGNLYTNLLVTTLYGTGLASLYLESTSLKKSKTKQGPPAITEDDVVDIVHDSPNRIFKPKLNTQEEKRQDLQLSDFRKVVHSLTYGDVSQFAIAWGFLMQLSNLIGSSSLGRKSLFYKGSVVGVVGFPSLIYMALRLRMKQLEKAGVHFE